MQYAFQLLPHPNVRYQSALEKLGKAELQCMLQALGFSTQPQMENIGGTPFLTFECPTMDTETLRPLSTLSSVYLWARREGEAVTRMQISRNWHSHKFKTSLTSKYIPMK